MLTRHAPNWTTRDARFFCPRRRDDIIQNEVDGEAILYDSRTDNTHRLNQTALAVWKRCDGAATTLQIAWQLVDAYDIQIETALDHVHELLAVFAESDLLTC